MTALRELADQVTNAILRAEHLERTGNLNDIAQAYLEVSRCEELLATKFPANNDSGMISRQGAVLAAIKAGDTIRAMDLINKYLADVDAPDNLVKELERLLKTISNEEEK
jgi:hypothetical protein